MLYDAFICHASEDKDSVARDLAHELVANDVSVWYDEFSLKVGDSLRQSIDRGLANSEYGIVILSQAFFRKRWPAWELDGLVERAMATENPLILPVWHGVSHGEVSSFSLPLSGRIAADTKDGVSEVVSKLLRTIRPRTSSVVWANRFLSEWGYPTVPPANDNWIGVVEFCARNRFDPTNLTVQSAAPWMFPLPPDSRDPQEKGLRLALGHVQRPWVLAGLRRKIGPLTHPSTVHAFLLEFPSLLDNCLQWPELALAYAPQLAIPGCEGPLQELVRRLEAKAHALKKESKSSGSNCGALPFGSGVLGSDPTLLLLHRRSHHFGSMRDVARLFFSGDSCFPSRVQYDPIDGLAWLASASSSWLPRFLRRPFTEHLLTDGSWLYFEGAGNVMESGSVPGSIYACRTKAYRMPAGVREVLCERLAETTRIVGLPEVPEQLLRKMQRAGYFRNAFSVMRGNND